MSATPFVASENYASAERFMAWNKDLYITNADIQHHWIGKEDRFWYVRTDAHGGKQFIVVDGATGHSTPAFNQKNIATALEEGTGSKVASDELPFATFRFVRDHPAIEFRLKDTLWTCETTSAHCESISKEDTVMPGEMGSPDGKRALSARNHNLWVRTLGSNEITALTTDGIDNYDYGTPLGSGGHTISDLRHPAPSLPLAVWSPDSRYVLTHRLDEREVKELYLVQSVPEDGSARPKVYHYRYAMPGDEHRPLLEPVVLDVVTRQQINLAVKPLIASIATLVERGDIWWSEDSKTVYFLNRDRFSKSVALEKADPVTGRVTEVLRETSDTAVNLLQGNRSARVLTNGDVIWYSQRDGWGHLYYYDRRTGKPRNQITRGNWVVRSIVRVDEATKQVFFMASGRERGWDPYEQCLYAVHFDGSGVHLLTPERGDHDLPSAPADPLSTPGETERFSASGRYFVDSYSRPDMPPIFVVRPVNSTAVTQLETADITKLKDGGYVPVEPFEVLAADGRTAIFGNLYRPSKFNPSRKYPVIDSIYSLPTVIRTGKTFSAAVFGYFEAQSLADLGFIVITIDGRGTAYRSKAFADHSYGQLDKASDLEDHIAGIRQLAQRYPYMDLNRVGADGVSAGGYGSAHAILAYPEFYKVAVAAEGNQDQRAGPAALEEFMLGPFNEKLYLAASNLPLAVYLKGKLLLAYGEMDESAPPSLTMKLVDALVKANKPFDLLIIPNETHLMFIHSSYFVQRKWDYFVSNLLGMQPPGSAE